MQNCGGGFEWAQSKCGIKHQNNWVLIKSASCFYVFFDTFWNKIILTVVFMTDVDVETDKLILNWFFGNDGAFGMNEYTWQIHVIYYQV